MIQAENLSFSYGKKQVLRNISLTLERGKLYAVVGANGSGKTTLLHTLARLCKGEGRLSLDGEDYETIGRRDFAQRLAVLPQNRHAPDMSVFDLVSAGRYPYSDISRKLSDEDLEIVNKALHFTDTERFSERNVKRLSGGERQRAYLAMLYAQDTPYVLLDEPTAHLDISYAFEVMHILARMKADRKCVVAVLHDLPLALKYADEIILLSNGEVVSAADPSETVRTGILEKIFNISCSELFINGSREFLFSEKKTAIGKNNIPI